MGWFLFLHNFIITIIVAGYTAVSNLIAIVFAINANQITIVIGKLPCI